MAFITYTMQIVYGLHDVVNGINHFTSCQIFAAGRVDEVLNTEPTIKDQNIQKTTMTSKVK